MKNNVQVQITGLYDQSRVRTLTLPFEKTEGYLDWPKVARYFLENALKKGLPFTFNYKNEYIETPLSFRQDGYMITLIGY